MTGASASPSGSRPTDEASVESPPEASILNAPAAELAGLKAQRPALDAQINLIEAGISKSAYDANLAWQLSVVNDQRIAAGKKPLSMGALLAVCDEEEGD